MSGKGEKVPGQSLISLVKGGRKERKRLCSNRRIKTRLGEGFVKRVGSGRSVLSLGEL